MLSLICFREPPKCNCTLVHRSTKVSERDFDVKSELFSSLRGVSGQRYLEKRGQARVVCSQ